MGAILDAALEYAEAGYAVIPVKRSDKAPLTDHGLTDASTDPETIRTWWKQYPDANVAIVCGKVSGNLLAIDVDIKPEENKHGDFYIESWQAGHGGFPETVVQITGSGGRHYFFRCDNIDSYKNTVDAIPSVDIRGDGAYVVVAPSVYSDGRTYKWDRGVSLLDTDEVANVNQSVIELLELNKRGSRSKSKAVSKQMRDVKAGNRNQTLFRYAAAQRAYDVPIEITMDAARALSNTWSSPLSESEIQKTVESAYKYEPNEATIYGEPPEPEPETDELEMKSLDQFTEEDVEWLIQGYIPKEQITLICGTGGTGKTSVWVSLIASLSSGERTLFDGSKPDGFVTKREPMKILFFSGEDTIEHVIKKRLRVQRANMKNIYTLSIDDQRFDRVKFNSKFLEALIRKYRPSLCVFDPLQSFIDGRIKMSDRNAMRQNMRCLIEWGKRYHTTFLIVMHTNKLQNVWGRARMADSADLWDIARSILMVGDAGEDDLKYLSQEKSNYGKTGQTMLFKNENGNPTFSRWVDLKDRDFVLADAKKRNENKQHNDAEDVENMILSILEEYPDGLYTSELDSLILETGYKRWTINKAKSQLSKVKKIRYKKTGMDEHWKVFKV